MASNSQEGIIIDLEKMDLQTRLKYEEIELSKKYEVIVNRDTLIWTVLPLTGDDSFTKIDFDLSGFPKKGPTASYTPGSSNSNTQPIPVNSKCLGTAPSLWQPNYTTLVKLTEKIKNIMSQIESLEVENQRRARGLTQRLKDEQDILQNLKYTVNKRGFFLWTVIPPNTSFPEIEFDLNGFPDKGPTAKYTTSSNSTPTLVDQNYLGTLPPPKGPWKQTNHVAELLGKINTLAIPPPSKPSKPFPFEPEGTVRSQRRQSPTQNWLFGTFRRLLRYFPRR